MARPLTAEEMNRVIYSKYLLGRAKALAAEGHEMALAGAVLGTHDASEMLMRVVSDVLNVKWNQFGEFWSNIESKGLPRPSRFGPMDQLNSERTAFKHKGILPNPAKVPSRLLEASAFCEEIAKDYLGLDYQSVTLADLIQNSGARTKLKDAEAAAARGDFAAAVTDCGNAFDILFAEARQKHKAALVGDIPIDNRDFVKSPATESMKSKIQKIGQTVDALILGIDPSRLRKFSETTPIRQRTGYGDVTVIWTRDDSKITKSDFDFCHSFVIASALQLLT
jgi:Rad3-related DNA helicase